MVEIVFKATLESRSLLERSFYVVFPSGRDDHRNGIIDAVPGSVDELVRQLSALGADPLVVTDDS